MYLCAHDEGRALAVWLADKMSPAEWQQHFEHLRWVASWSQTTGKRAACMLITLDSFDRPDARTRAELARHTEAPGYDPYVAFITPNAAVRGFLTMMKWVQTKPRYEVAFFGDSGAGLGWLEQQRGQPLPELKQMIDEVKQQRSQGQSRPRL